MLEWSVWALTNVSNLDKLVILFLTSSSVTVIGLQFSWLLINGYMSFLVSHLCFFVNEKVGVHSNDQLLELLNEKLPKSFTLILSIVIRLLGSLHKSFRMSSLSAWLISGL